MKHDCPYCGTKLAWRLVTSKPLPGERKVLPNQAVPVCPACRGMLALNTHWSEIAFLGVIGIPFLLLPEIRSSFGNTGWLYAGAVTLVLWVATAILFQLRYWRQWQRYKPYAPKQIPR